MFIAKLKGITNFTKKTDNLFDLSIITDQLNSGLLGVVETAFINRQQDGANSVFSEADVAKVIDDYAKRNMILAAASSIIPGPLGILGAVPELILNFGNQMNMIYDLGCAHGKEQVISKDLLLDIPFAAFGGNTNLKALQDANELLNPDPAMLQEKASALGKNVIEKNLKKSVVQFIPVSGPLLMGIWAKMTTKKIAGISTNFFDAKSIYDEKITPTADEETKIQIKIQKIKALANLIEVNGDIDESQIAFIAPIIAHADLPQDRKNYFLEEAQQTGSDFKLNFSLLKEYQEEEDLLMELIVMAKRSGSIDRMEKGYIIKVAKELDIKEEEVLELMED